MPFLRELSDYMDDKSNKTELTVEVGYAKSQKQKILEVSVKAGTTVYNAVVQSGIMDYFPEIDLKTVKLGIFGIVVIKPKEQILKGGERVEIYRPLIADPREVRRQRAEQAKLKK